jgi:hypothetical protein
MFKQGSLLGVVCLSIRYKVILLVRVISISIINIIEVEVCVLGVDGGRCAGRLKVARGSKGIEEAETSEN